MDSKPRKSLHRMRSIDRNTPLTQQILSYSLSKAKHKPLIKSNNKLRNSNLESRAQRSLDPAEISTKDTDKFTKAKNLYKQFKLQEAYRQFEYISRMHPHHQECLYLLGVTCINLDKPVEAVKYFQKLLQVSPDYKQNVYLLAAISYNRVREVHKALELLSKAIQKNDGFFEAYCYRAKLLVSMNKFSKAEDDYDKAISLNPRKPVVLIGKADCLRARGDDKQALSYYNKALQQTFNRNVLLKRASLYYQTRQYSKSLDDINLLMEEPTSEVLYYRGLLYLNYENDEAKAVISFETAIKTNKNPVIQRLCIVELLKFRIDSCDFYECTNVLQMAKLYNIRDIAPWECLVEAVIALMKKKHQEADRLFDLLEKQLISIESEYEYIHPLTKLYRGYCHFCLFRYEKAYQYSVQYKTYMNTVLGKIIEDERVNYNTDLFQALMLCQSGCLDDSLQKLNQMLQTNKNFELYFYRLMVMMKVAISEDPFLGEMDTKQEILLYVLELMPDIPEGATSPCLLYYEALLKSYFGIYSQAEKSINKAIEKAEENLGRLFQLRAIINCQLQNNQQAVNDLSICINIQQRAQYFRDRARVYQLMGEAEQAYEDLQRYIEMETDEEEISKWASILLFANRAYEEASRALNKIQDINSFQELKEIKDLIALFEGRFEDAGVQGKVLKEVIEGKDQIGLDRLISSKGDVGYFPPQYTYFLRVIHNYSQSKYSLALKDLQLLLFTFGTQENRKNLVVEIKYSIMICHLLNNDIEKARIQFKGLTEIVQVVNNIEQALAKGEERQFQDLSQYFTNPHMSQFIPYKCIPNTKIKLKLSIPFPQPPPPNLQIKVTESFLNQRIKVEAVDGKGQAPWIRRNPKGKYQFTNQVVSMEISMISSQNNSVLM